VTGTIDQKDLMHSDEREYWKERGVNVSNKLED
jgi:hypothetical protein